MSSAKPRRNSLADAFGVDADELRNNQRGETPNRAEASAHPLPPTTATTEEQQTPANAPSPTATDPAPDGPPWSLRPAVADDIVEIGGHEYIRYADGRLDPADNTSQLNFTITVKERHLLRRLAYEERRSLVSYLREILESRGLL
jgi:hypothetical protein